jgi:SAM-dependent methyltransferase
VTHRPVTQAERWDPPVVRKLAETGVGAGWRCLEIGAGTGPVAAWLADRVGSRGQVVAVDIQAHRFDVRCHGTATDAGTCSGTGTGSGADGSWHPRGYHLIHARLVFDHVPQRRALATSFVAALRPGGWLVVEDYDQPAPGLALHGGPLVSLLRGTGLVDVAAEGLDDGGDGHRISARALVCARGRRPTVPGHQGAIARGR